MVTRESKVNNYWMTETRPRLHWICFDLLGLLMQLATNSWLNSPKMFAWTYEKYTKFTLYSRPHSTLVIKKMVGSDGIPTEYSEVLREAIAKLESSSPPPAIH
jgi:hypothetical protein